MRRIHGANHGERLGGRSGDTSRPGRAGARAGLLGAGLLLGALAVTGTAGAATIESKAAASGQLTLFAGPDFTGAATVVDYTTCGLVRQVSGQVGAFDNRPLPGCRVALNNSAGASFTLCAGRGVVPVAFRQSPRVRIQPGDSSPCAVATSL
ncbi:hypothetical protein [Actinomadura sp. HBU206391]|uniref:hypothetical protein n=1 Tax=Actinomadura sp. HBU206391 TaxID=2731692 RepID=UPI00164FC76E|nr:hypothetical protein [Actinomadura sp. HBU206391]MBC6459107.1 hypothetical protein [Actinomadura sp. HBU206391]